MKLGDVIRKEREKRQLSLEQTAEALRVPVEDFEQLEHGETEAEQWAPLLAQIAIKLSTPTSRLLADSGRSSDTHAGQAGKLIQKHRERRRKSVEEMAKLLNISQEEYERIERGESPIEEYGPLLLGFAEVIEQPMFNLFYPCGVDFRSLRDYP